jgi:HAD superfamily hydrolase (TIGR01509 family)
MPSPIAADLARPAAVLFDLDGTLTDTVEARISSWIEVFERYSVPASREQVAALIGVDGKRLATQVAAAGRRPIDDALAEEIDRVCGEIFEQRKGEPRSLPGVRAIVDAIGHAGIKWAIATSSRREQVATSIDALRLPGEPTIVDGSHVEHAKPEPDLLLLAAREVEVEPARCWYVGDSTWDMVSAVAAGMIPVGVTAGSAVDAAALRASGAQLVVGTLDELVAPILGSTAGHSV